jgi:peptide/nickel transport system permease protein
MAELELATPSPLVEPEPEIYFAPRRRVRFRSLPLRLKIGAGGVLVTLLAAIVLPFVVPGDPFGMDPNTILQSPSPTFPLGTDDFGRSILARAALGMRTTYEISISVCLVTLVVGGALGLITGYVRRVDMILMRIVDAVMAIPGIMLALATATVFGASAINTVLAISLSLTPRTIRVMRSSVFGVKETMYVEGARALGVGHIRILWRHILPNAVSPLIIQQTFVLAVAVLGEAALSFIGVGVQPPSPTLGNMLSDAQKVLQQAPWYAIFPGVLISIIVMSVNTLGDGIRDFLDVRGRNIR